MRIKGRSNLPQPFQGVTLTYEIDHHRGRVDVKYVGRLDQLLACRAIDLRMAQPNPGRRIRSNVHGERYLRRSRPNRRIEVSWTTTLLRAAQLPGMECEEVQNAIRSSQDWQGFVNLWVQLDPPNQELAARLMHALSSACRHGDELTKKLFCRMAAQARGLGPTVDAIERRVRAYDLKLPQVGQSAPVSA